MSLILALTSPGPSFAADPDWVSSPSAQPITEVSVHRFFLLRSTLTIR